MRLSMSKRDLTSAFSHVSPYLAKRSLDVLEHAHLEADQDGISLTATDLEVGAHVSVTGEVLEAGNALIPIKAVKDVIKRVKPSSEVGISYGVGNRIDILCDDEVYRLDPVPDPDFPSCTFGASKTWKIDGAAFRSVLERTVYAASTEETRYFLNGVYFDWDASATSFVATDGRRLAVATHKPLIKGKASVGVIVPFTAVKRLIKTFGKSEWVRVGTFKDNGALMVAFTDGVVDVTSRTVDGEYPKYREVIPSEHKHSVLVNRETMLEVVSEVVSFHKEHKSKVPSMRCDFTPESVKVSARNNLYPSDDRVMMENSVPLVSGNGTITLAMDCNYVNDALTHIATDEVEIRLIDELSAIKLLPNGADDHLNLVMPMRLDS